MHDHSNRSSFATPLGVADHALRVALIAGSLLLGTALPARAAVGPQSLTLSVGQLAAAAGDTIEVPVQLSSVIGVSELSALKFAVRVDTLALRPLAATRGDVLAAWPPEDFHAVVDGDRLSISALTATPQTIGGQAVPISTGEFVRMRFVVREDAVDGWVSPLDITATDDEQAIVMLSQPAQAPPGIKTFALDGSVVVSSGSICLRGDASGDGLVGTDDAILALRRAAGLWSPTDPLSSCGADANADGMYNAFDATWILSTVVGLPVAQAKGVDEEPTLRLEARSDGLWVVIDAADGVRAAELALAADEGLRWLPPRGPQGTLLVTDAREGLLRLALASPRSSASTMEFRLPCEGAGTAALVHARLYGSQGEPMRPRVEQPFAEWVQSPGPAVRALALSSYPNPFNPTTTLRLEVPRSGRATLEIFDAAGRRVALLLDEDVPAGTRSVEWQGHDARGGKVASGVYFARLIAGGQQARQRLLLVK